MGASESGYSLSAATPTLPSAGGETKADRQRAYAYMRKHLLMFDSEVAATKRRLAYFAEQSSVDLTAVFVEEIQTWPTAFERFLQAVVKDEVELVILPSMLHFAVLGSPSRIKYYFERATGARVITLHGAVSHCPGEAAS